ncbi:MAG: hypothetical protein KGZ25_07395, partial [Planctomycetes bacterium]|nr:hypothetical protein [Planctomycetota bacterium]
MEQSQKRLTSLLLSTLFLYVFATSLNAANRSIYWRPYEHGPDAVALFHCDGAAGEAAQSVDDVVGGAEDDGAGGALWPGGMSGGGADEAGALANANPVGKEATLIHGAGKTDNGRFNGGVHLPNSKAIVRFK